MKYLFPFIHQAYVYASDEESAVRRPEKELKGFRKVWLDPGETRRVEITISLTGTKKPATGKPIPGPTKSSSVRPLPTFIFAHEVRLSTITR